MKISVIIPTHNRAAFLKRSLDSVFNQSYKPSEVILVDDASTDKTDEIAATYKDLTYLKLKKNLGVSGARNAGIKIAKFDWIAFLDSDDEWLLTKLESQKAKIEETGLKICHTQETWMRNGSVLKQKKKHQKYGGEVYENCLPICFISPSTSIIHKSIFEDVGLFREDFPVCEDYDLWLRICSKYEVALVESSQINKYGGHDDQLSYKYHSMDKWRFQALKSRLDDPLFPEKLKALTFESFKSRFMILKKGYIKYNNQKELEALENDFKLTSDSI